MHPFRRTSVAIVSALLICLSFTGVRAHGLEIEAARMSELSSAGGDHKAYLTILNEAFHPEYLYQASSPIAERIELHRVSASAEMVSVKRVEIPLDDRLDMRRAGYHLMLIGVKRVLKPGETIPVTLTFGEGRKQKATISVAGAVDPKR